MAEMRACSYVNRSDAFSIRVRTSLDPDDDGFVIAPGSNVQSHQASILYIEVCEAPIEDVVVPISATQAAIDLEPEPELADKRLKKA